MKASKILIALLLFTLLISQASAQSFNTNSPIEESLVNFVNQVLGFPASSASDVILYFIAPIAGLYFLLSNFMAYGFENFEERLGRRDYISSEEDELPRGLKLLSLIISFITVTTVGAASGGMALIGLIALALIIAILLGLMGGGEGNGDNNGNGGGGGNNNNNGGGQNQGGNNQQESEHSWWDVLERGSELGADAASAAKNYTEKQRKKQIKESLKHFETHDFVSEIDDVLNNLTSLTSDIEQAKRDLKNNNKSSDAYNDLYTRLQTIKDKKSIYYQSYNNDAPGTYTYSPGNSELCQKISNDLANDDSLYAHISKLDNDLERILENSSSAGLPSDSFNQVVDDMKKVSGVSYFIIKSPYSLDEIKSDRDVAEEILKVAYKLGCCNNLSNSKVSEFTNVAARLENNYNEIKALTNQAYSLTKANLKVYKNLINDIESTFKDSGDVKKYISNIFTEIEMRYNNHPKPSPSNPETYTEIHERVFDNCEDKIGDIRTKTARLNNRIGSGKATQAQLVEKLEYLSNNMP
jgi:hypothetical protein